MTVHTGTQWVQPCPFLGQHHYRRPVVSTDVANELERDLERVRRLAIEALDAIDAYAAEDLDHQLHQLVEHHRRELGVADA